MVIKDLTIQSPATTQDPGLWALAIDAEGGSLKFQVISFPGSVLVVNPGSKAFLLKHRLRTLCLSSRHQPLCLGLGALSYDACKCPQVLTQ